MGLIKHYWIDYLGEDSDGLGLYRHACPDCDVQNGIIKWRSGHPKRVYHICSREEPPWRLAWRCSTCGSLHNKIIPRWVEQVQCLGCHAMTPVPASDLVWMDIDDLGEDRKLTITFKDS